MATAQELISQAENASTEAQLADIEARSEGRSTVEDAVKARRKELRDQQAQGNQGNAQPPASGSATAENQGRMERQAPRAVGQPPQGQAESREVVQQEPVESADPHAPMPDALGNEPRRVIDVQREQAEGPAETGLHGLALPQAGEVAGGNIQKVLLAPEDPSLVHTPLAKERAAMTSNVGRQIASLIARPITEWGVLGPGDVVKGHMILIDLNSGAKVRAMDGHRINEGELYMNARNAPEALSTGDTIDKVLG